VVAVLQQHDLAFYSTAAQVLPVLVIVALVELRYLPAQTDELPGPWRFRATFGYCVLATVTEFKLLLAARNGQRGDCRRRPGHGCLDVGYWAVFAAPIIAIQRATKQREAKAQQDKRNRI